MICRCSPQPTTPPRETCRETILPLTSTAFSHAWLHARLDSTEGTTGSCTCTSCQGGYGGASCETADACSTSTDPSKDGSDGSFYCINGGTVGGSAGSCTCTSCNAGYEGVSCQTASACDNAAASIDFGVASPCTSSLASGSSCSSGSGEGQTHRLSQRDLQS